MNKINVKALVEASLLAALAALILIVSVNVPIFMIFGAIIWPLPITFLTFKYNIKISVLSLIVALFIGGLVTGPVSTLSLGLLYGLPAIVLGYCLKKRYSPFITVVAMAISIFVAYIVIIKVGEVLTGVNALEDIYKIFNESITRSKDMLKSMGIPDEQINKSIPKDFNADYLKVLFPGALALASVMGAFINYYFAGLIFRKLRMSINEMKPLDVWYINSNLSFGLFFITIVSWILMSLKVNNADVVFMTIFVIFQFVFTINGYALLYWFLKAKGIGKKLRVTLVVVAFLTGLTQLLFFAGLIDYALDFRKLNPMRNRRIPPGE